LRFRHAPRSTRAFALLSAQVSCFHWLGLDFTVGCLGQPLGYQMKHPTSGGGAGLLGGTSIITASVTPHQALNMDERLKQAALPLAASLCSSPNLSCFHASP